MAKRFDVAKLEEWRRRLARFENANSTVLEFCRREEVSQASFYYWTKRVGQTGAAGVATRTQHKRVAAASPDAVASAVVEVIGGDSIRVHLPMDRLDAVATFVRHLRDDSASEDSALDNGRFQRIALAPSTPQP